MVASTAAAKTPRRIATQDHALTTEPVTVNADQAGTMVTAATTKAAKRRKNRASFFGFSPADLPSPNWRQQPQQPEAEPAEPAQIVPTAMANDFPIIKNEPQSPTATVIYLHDENLGKYFSLLYSYLYHFFPYIYNLCITEKKMVNSYKICDLVELVIVEFHEIAHFANFNIGLFTFCVCRLL